MKPLRFIKAEELKDSREFLELTLPRGSVFFIVAMAVIVVTSFAWAFWGEIDIIVKAQVLLRPRENISILKNETTGTVVEKAFVQGQRVEKGQILWKISSQDLDVDEQKSTLQLERIVRRFDQWSALQSAYTSGVTKGLTVGSEAWAKAAVYFGELKRLDLEVQKADRAWKKERSLPASMSLPEKLKDLELNTQGAKVALANFKTKSTLEVIQTLDSLTQERENLEKRLASLRKQKEATIVKSPIAGKVQEIARFNIGDTLLMGEELAHIIPEGASDLRVEIQVDNQNIAEIKPGMICRVRFSALPASEYGQIESTITDVPADAQMMANTPPFFLLQGDLNQTTVKNRRGELVALKSGMVGEGKILLKRKTILRFLLEKLDFIW